MLHFFELLDTFNNIRLVAIITHLETISAVFNLGFTYRKFLFQIAKIYLITSFPHRPSCM